MNENGSQEAIDYLGECNSDQDQDNETQAGDQALDTGTMDIIGPQGCSQDQCDWRNTKADDLDSDAGQHIDHFGDTVPDKGEWPGEGSIGEVLEQQPPDDSGVEQ